MALVLCIDDDRTVANIVAEIVEKVCGHEAEIESDPVVAVSRWLRHPDLAVVISDLMMPKLDGIELLSIFMENRPAVRRILITAAPREPEVRAAKREGIIQMLISKPHTVGDVQNALAWL